MRGFSPNCQKHHRLYLDSISSGILIAQMVYDDQSQPADALILEVNSAFAAVVDRPKESIPGKRLRNLYPGLGPKWLRKCAEIMEKGVSERLEPYSGALGGWFEFLVSPLADGKFGVMLTDISERKEMEILLQESESRYRKLFETANDGFWWLDNDGYLIETNEGTANLLGYRPEDLVGRH